METETVEKNDTLQKLKSSVVCPVELSLRILGGKWRGSILYQLREENLRFNELLLSVQDGVVYYDDTDHILTTKVLAEHLAVLQDCGLVEKVSGQSMSDKTVYKYGLTLKGKSVIPLLIELFHWGEESF